ncbi:hypothetical protein H5410_050469 [Solanum commersonii]|uniref:Uncharacterized protein n=1 Tax=Solanum commersonii TaxID=4109 RepID=A0A9J5WVL6_SOLCO|nr:hypothetical protein H5410_050469 [Solanum commersonii]
MDELGSFLAKIFVRTSMAIYHDFRKLLVQEKIFLQELSMGKECFYQTIMYLKNKINLKK